MDIGPRKSKAQIPDSKLASLKYQKVLDDIRPAIKPSCLRHSKATRVSTRRLRNWSESSAMRHILPGERILRVLSSRTRLSTSSLPRRIL